MDERLPCTIAEGRRRQAIPLLELAIGSLVAVAMISSASAASLYWDMNNNFPGATDDPSNKATGSWTRTLTNWSTDANGLANTGPWTANSDAVFAASNDATSSYDVTVTSSYSPYANSIHVQDATITFYGLYPNTATIYLTGDARFEVASGKTAYISSRMRIAGSAGLTKTGPGLLSFTSGAAANTYTGPTRVLGGQLTVAGDTNLSTLPTTPAAGNLVLGGDGRLHFGGTTINPNRGMQLTTGGGSLSSNHGTTLTYGGIIADDPAAPGQSFTHDTYQNRLILSGANTFTGQLNHSISLVTVNHSNALGSTAGATIVGSNATLQLEGNISIGAEPLTLNGNGYAGGSGFAAQSGALVNLSGDNSFGGTISLAGTSTHTISSDSGTLTLTHAIATTSGASKSLTLAGAGNGTVNGALGHSANLTKNGTGTWTLLGNNTYTGTTTVSTGKLVINGQLATAAGTTSVKSGAKLAGSGQLRDVTVENNGTIEPGSEVSGTLSARNLVLGSSSILLFDFGGDTPSRISLAGNLTLDGLLNLVDASMQEGTYRLFDYTGSLTDNGLQIGTAPQGMSYSISTTTANQVNLVVQLGIVPEPTSVGLIALAVGGLLRRRSFASSEDRS